MTDILDYSSDSEEYNDDNYGDDDGLLADKNVNDAPVKQEQPKEEKKNPKTLA